MIINEGFKTYHGGNVPNRVLVTGASGFVGRALCETLANAGYEVRGVSRQHLISKNPKISFVRLEAFNAGIDFSEVLSGVDVVVHCAGKTTTGNSGSCLEAEEFFACNTDVTENLARQALTASVKRFIFLSSAKVHGEKTEELYLFTETSEPNPAGPYASSKIAAEEKLKTAAVGMDMDVVIVRPPRVYCPGAGRNFNVLTKIACLGLPLPFGSVCNKRSFISIENLVDFIIRCVEHPLAAGETFVVSDNDDLSTRELLEKVAHAASKSAYLFPFPSNILRYLMTLLGKQGIADRLFESFQVDSSYAMKTLEWVPPLSVDEGLRRSFVRRDAD